MKIAHCSNVACSAATFATLDSAGNVGGFTSITVGADGLGLISYEDFTNFDLKVAHCSNVACSAATTQTLDSAGGEYTSIAIGHRRTRAHQLSRHDELRPQGRPLLERRLPTAATTPTLDSTGSVGGYTFAHDRSPMGSA